MRTAAGRRHRRRQGMGTANASGWEASVFCPKPRVLILGCGGAVVIAVATTPFKVERGRLRTAQAGIQRLRSNCDSLIVLDNNRLLDLVPNLPVERAFSVMDVLIAEVIKGVTEAINLPSLINLDFNDVRTVLSEGGTSA